MDTASIVVMIIVFGIVWGGFAAFLILAWRKEREKRDSGKTGTDTFFQSYL